MERIEKQFNEKLAPILRVLDSCQTPDQLNSALHWGEEVLLGVADQLENKGTAQERNFAKSYKYTAYSQVKQRYMDKMAEMTSLEVRTVIRDIAPHLTICRNCSGLGFVFNRADRSQPSQECRFCKGSGKVKVSSRVVTKVRPFVPGKDDRFDAITME